MGIITNQLIMGVLGQLRRTLAYWMYTPPTPIDGEGSLSSEGIVDIALSSSEKRDVIRSMAYHLGSRNRHSPDRGGNYALNWVSGNVVRDGSLSVSTDPTDYDDMDTYYSTVSEARTEHLRESVLPELVNAKVLQATTGGEEWVTNMSEATSEITGVRPGTRFEFAVQALRWIDENGSQYDWKSF